MEPAATHTQPFYGSVEFVQDNLGEPVPEETFTHSHSSWSSIMPVCFLHLLRTMASSLFNPSALQSFSAISLQVFFGLPLGLVPSASYSIHFFTQSLSSFHTYPVVATILSISSKYFLQKFSKEMGIQHPSLLKYPPWCSCQYQFDLAFVKTYKRDLVNVGPGRDLDSGQDLVDIFDIVNLEYFETCTIRVQYLGLCHLWNRRCA